MSPSTSIARGRSWSSTRAWKQVYSFAVNALNSPPTASSAIEMSIADRRRGALEQQVLEEVRGTVQRRRLVTRADAHPRPDRGGPDTRHRLGDDPQPARQDGPADL